MTKKEKSCGAVVIHHEGTEWLVLLQKHIKGHWSFPKGHVEANETEMQTAIREIKEETNLDVTIDTGFRFIVTYAPDLDTCKDVVYFVAVADTADTSPQLSEVQEIRWLSLDEADALITFENDVLMYRAAKAYILSELSKKQEVT